MPGHQTRPARIAAAGGLIVKENAAVGVATVRASPGAFGALATATPQIEGVAHNVTIGQAPAEAAKRRDVERLAVAEQSSRVTAAALEGR